MKIEKKIAFVSGANRGIGKALVDELLKNGVEKVYAGARSTASLPNWADDRVVPIELDITNKEQVEAVAKQTSDANLLINNAGVASFSSILDGPMDNVESDMNTNYFGTLNMVRSFTPNLEKLSEAAIVNIVTIGAFVNFPVIGGYCASKAAVFSMSQAARMELAPKGIAVHTVNPGPIDTDMTKSFDADKTSPEVTAANIISELKAGTVDIFPDPGSQGMFEVWKKDYRELEKMVSQS
ncbi:MAG: SDR family oxidoreductase [Bdellovibrionales bacterium]